MDNKGWIGVDLDGTLAFYDKWRGIDHIGQPIEKMVNRVKKFLNEGIEVRIFTARSTVPESIPHIEKWCLEHIGKILPITYQKDFDMIVLYDDRCIQVQKNSGLTYSDYIDSIWDMVSFHE